MRKAIVTCLALATAAVSVKAISFEIAATAGSEIVFPGDGTFNFNPVANNFIITTPTSPLLSLQGEMTGTWTIDAITTSSGLSVASVGGAGSLVIHDGLGEDLTADLEWLNIIQSGTVGGLNTTGTLNVKNVSYSGSLAELQCLVPVASETLTFQFNPSVSLTVLKEGPGPNTTSFSGSLTCPVPDTGVTVAMFGLGLLGLAAVRRCQR